jgi:predicted ATPase/DNA-binding SARP family transcriptional activator/predicted negative regulator of RcsB-dependent stress response
MSGATPSESWLRLHFLGGCEILLPDGPGHLETAKTRALLVYLASNPGPQPRQTLMGLLWGELPEANARRNLRRALWNLRRQLAAPGRPPPIVSDRETVCFNRKLDYRSDVETFEAACSKVALTDRSPASGSNLDDLREAVVLYQGEFLEGFYISEALAFEEWALTERERLRLLALRALQYLVEGYAARNEDEQALLYARQLLAMEPWREEAHRSLMRLLAGSGRRAEALAQYETCKQVLAEGLGVEPARETQSLYEQIRAGAFAIPPSNLPASTTPFVGRVRELAEIADLLADTGCRLLTVTGLGGVGKTRLAREVAAQQVTAFAHGVHYVELGALGAAGRLMTALVQSLDIPLVGSADPKVPLLAYLREKQMLVVMDGFEHLLEEASVLTEILQAAPGIKILVTSRERLNLRGEWVYALLGLECVPAEQVGELVSSDAVQLFLQTARRVHLGFQVREGEHLHLARICNLVGGLPLAIELAAAWIRVLSLEEIAAEITQHLDFLVTATRDRPERHRSLRAVFDHSWRLLSEKEQDAFRKLSVFQDGFGPHEAAQVSGASLPTLSALVDQSLLQRTTSGRYQVHELLRQYAHEQLEQVPGERELVCDLHCQVYATSVAQCQQSRKSLPHHQIVRSFAADMENILAAWWWAIQQRNLKAIASMCRGLTDYFQLTSSFRDGEALFRETLDELGWPGAGDIQAITGDLLAWELLSVQAMFSLYLGQLPQARDSLERCVAVFDHHGVVERVAHCQFFLGEIARFLGELHSAREFYRQSLANYQQIDDRAAVGFCLNGLGLVSSALNELAQARSCFRDSLVAFVETSHEMGQAIVSINLADLLIKLGEHSTAREILDEGFVLCQKLGHRWGMATCLRHLGGIAELDGRAEDAKAAYRESLGILQDVGQRQTAAGCLIKLGQVCTDLGQFAEARQHLKKALAITAELQDESQLVDAALSLAWLLAAEGEREKALALVRLVERHPAKAPAAQKRVSQLTAELAYQIPEDASQLMQRRTRAGTLEDILAESYLLLRV